MISLAAGLFTGLNRKMNTVNSISVKQKRLKKASLEVDLFTAKYYNLQVLKKKNKKLYEELTNES